MMKRMITFLVLLVLVLSTYGTAFAQEESEVPACEGENITGTVVAVDEESGLITVDPDLEVEGDECTVFLTGDFGHPITTLLGSYFGEVNIEDLTEALETTQVCAIHTMIERIKAGKRHSSRNPTVQDFISALQEAPGRAYTIYEKMRERDFDLAKAILDALEPVLPIEMRLTWKAIEAIHDELQ